VASGAVSLNSNTLILQSDVLGKITLPRTQIVLISLGAGIVALFWDFNRLRTSVGVETTSLRPTVLGVVLGGVAVATPGSRLGRYLTAILGSPAVAAGDVTAWRIPR
jgi:hypothetical protein